MEGGHSWRDGGWAWHVARMVFSIFSKHDIIAVEETRL